MAKLCTPTGGYTKNKLILFISFVLILTSSFAAASKHVLIYTKNGKGGSGYVHKNLADSVECLKKICDKNEWTYEATDDASVFTAEKVKTFDVLIFSNTNNETFDTDEQKKVFKEYINNGGGFVGIHSACGSERQWPWFWANLGGKFRWHPAPQPFDVKVIDTTHPSTAHLGNVWKWQADECYFLNELNPGMHVLLAADITSLKKDRKHIDKLANRTFGDYFPVCWCQEFDGGRQWYTALGHYPKHYSDPTFVQHLEGGISWAMRKNATKTKTN